MAKSKKEREAASSAVFDALEDYLAHLQENSVSEVYITTLTNPPIARDPRADVYHILMTARVGKAVTTYVNATDLTAVDQLARGTEFTGLIEERVQPYIAAAEAAGLTVKRGRLES